MGSFNRPSLGIRNPLVQLNLTLCLFDLDDVTDVSVPSAGPLPVPPDAPEPAPPEKVGHVVNIKMFKF